MDRLDRLVSVLKREGICYSLTINITSAKAGYVSDVAPNRHPVKHKRYMFAQLMDDDAIAGIEEWFKAVFSHKNRYTGLTYAADPANVFVATVNEDSLYNGYFRDGGKLMSPANWELLTDQFNEFLRKRYRSERELGDKV